MALTTKITYGSLASVDSSTLSGSFVSIGSPLLYQSGIVKFVNNSNVLITVSIDGVNECDILPANSFFLYDITSNLPNGLQGSFFPEGTQFYIKGSSGTGRVYLAYLYLMPSQSPALQRV